MKYQSNILSDARGKLNGMVFSRGRYGAVIRNKVSPVQPDTSAQQLAKQNFGALSASFRALTQAEINAWNAAALNWPKSNAFGQTYYPSGLNLYVGLNQNLLQSNSPAITEAPNPEELPVMEVAGLSWDTADGLIFDVQVDGASLVPAGYNLVVDATPPVSAGRSFVKTLFRQIAVEITATATESADLSAQYVAKFGTPAVGAKFYCRAKLVNIATGQASLYVQAAGVKEA